MKTRYIQPITSITEVAAYKLMAASEHPQKLDPVSEKGLVEGGGDADATNPPSGDDSWDPEAKKGTWGSWGDEGW